MNFDARTNLNTREPEPLPAIFSPEMRAVDDELRAQARQVEIPLGLSDRVFAASVKELPRELPGAGDRRLRFPSWAVRHGVWGQLAMAASVALAFGIALWFVYGPHTKRAAGASDTAASLAAALRPLSAEPDPFENDFSYLLETSDLNSAEDIKSELVMLVRELEM